MNLRLNETYDSSVGMVRACATGVGRVLLSVLQREDPAVIYYRELSRSQDIIGPILVGASRQQSLFEWQNDPGTWYIDTRPRNGKPVRRFSERVPSDFKGLKDEVFEVPVAAAAVLKLNERYAGEV